MRIMLAIFILFIGVEISLGKSQFAAPQQPPQPKPTAQFKILFDDIPDPSVEQRADAFDASKFLIIYQGCDPQAASTGRIDTDAVLKEIARKIAGGVPTWGMLDFEDPFTSNLQAGVDSPKYQSTIQSMIATIRVVKERYPNIKWTYYGTPFLSYWLDGKNWSNATTEAKKALLDRIYKIYAPLVAEEDWVSPSVYPVYDPLMFEPKTPDAVRESGRAWRISSVGIAKILAAGKPVIPTISPYWQPNGVAKAGTIVPQAQFLEDMVAPIVEAGANGVALWSSVGYCIELAIDGYAKKMHQEENFGTRVWRDAFIQEYLENRPPTNWDDPMLRATLLRKASLTILDSIRSIRSFRAKDVSQ